MSRNLSLAAAVVFVGSSQLAHAVPSGSLPAPDFGYASLAIIAAVTACVAGLVTITRRRGNR
jgi:hypothetical protein